MDVCRCGASLKRSVGRKLNDRVDISDEVDEILRRVKPKSEPYDSLDLLGGHSPKTPHSSGPALTMQLSHWTSCTPNMPCQASMIERPRNGKLSGRLAISPGYVWTILLIQGMGTG